MIIGIHSRDNDLEVNVLKGKKLTNIRAAGKDEAVKLTPPIRMSTARSTSTWCFPTAHRPLAPTIRRS